MRLTHTFKWIEGRKPASDSTADAAIEPRTDSGIPRLFHAHYSRFSYHWPDYTTRLESSRSGSKYGRHIRIIEQTRSNARREMESGGVGQSMGSVSQEYGRMKSFHVAQGGVNVAKMAQMSLCSYGVHGSSSVTDSGCESEGRMYAAENTGGAHQEKNERDKKGDKGGGCTTRESSKSELVSARGRDNEGDLSRARYERRVRDEYSSSVMESWSEDGSCSLVARSLSADRLKRWYTTVGNENVRKGNEEGKGGGEKKMKRFQRVWRRSESVLDRNVGTSGNVLDHCGPSKVRYHNAGQRRGALKSGWKDAGGILRRWRCSGHG